MATKPRPGYLQSLNYPGSSGSWAFQGSGASGTPAGGSIPGYGYPGDVAMGNVPNPNAPRTAQIGAGGTSSLYKPLEIVKSPLLAAGTQALMEAFRSGADSIPGYTDLLNEAKNITGNFRNSFNRTNAALDLGPYAAGQRASDATAAGYTNRFSGQANDILGQYAGNDARYADQLGDITSRAYGMLPEYDRSARAIGDDQLEKLMGQISRYKIAGGNLGVGTDELRKIARGVANVELPLEQARIQRMYDVLTGLELPSQREIANRESTRLTNVELPVARDIYGLNVGDTMRSKQTEQQLKQLEITTAGMSMQAARDYLQSLSLPAELIQRVLQSKNQTLAGQIANLSGIGNIENDAYYRGLEYTPGASLASPMYFPMNLPPLPSMGGGRGTTPVAGGGASYNDSSPNWRDWSPQKREAETNRLRSMGPSGQPALTPGWDRLMAPTWDENEQRVIYPSERKNMAETALAARNAFTPEAMMQAFAKNGFQWN